MNATTTYRAYLDGKEVLVTCEQESEGTSRVIVLRNGEVYDYLGGLHIDAVRTVERICTDIFGLTW